MYPLPHPSLPASAQYSKLSCECGCICLPRVYAKIARKCEYEGLRVVSMERLKVDLVQTFFSRLIVPTLILYYDLLPRIWSESGFLADQIAFKGQEQIVRTLFFASLLGSIIECFSSWPFSLYRQNRFDDRQGTTTLFDTLFDMLMKFPLALQVPKHLFWCVAWSHVQSFGFGAFPALWAAETIFLAVSYEVVEFVLDALGLFRLPHSVVSSERCDLDLSGLKTYYSSESVAASKVCIFRNMVALPVSLFGLPFSGDQLTALCLRYLGLVEVNCILSWRMMERVQAACLYYLIHSMVGTDALMVGLGLGTQHPVVLRWIIIDYFVYPVLKTMLTMIRHHCNHQQEFRADAKTKLLGYNVALDAAIGKWDMYQERFPIEDPIYNLMFHRTPTAVQRIEALSKCPIRQ